MKALLKPLCALGLSAGVLLGTAAALRGTAERNARAEEETMLAALLPGGAPFTQTPYDGEDGAIAALYQGTGGWVIETVTAGYAGDITLLVGVEESGRVTGAVVRDMAETYGLGWEALTHNDFLRQTMGAEEELTVGENVDALTGATVTSKAILRGINAARGYVTGADVGSGATEWGG